KGLEVYHTFMIELIWKKKRILETYLNVAEMGKGIFGIQAAAQPYFKKNAIDLSKSEAAWIAAILPNPVLFSIKKPIPLLVRKHNWIMKQMNNLEDDPETARLISNE
ncbi:MAG: transglycosylase domain-containing protein, partial [Chitinophagaceae bacterium]|nr:transglycosylase domain-containing protein [Chitinophagaceae bacterium]